MYNDRRKKIIRISLIILGVVILVLVYLFIKNKQQGNLNTKTKGNFFLDLGSLITGKRQSPNGVSLITNNSGLGGSNGSGNGSGNGNGLDGSNGSGSPFISAGLPDPTPIAQNIGGGFGTNNSDLFPDGQDPNNCIGCSDINPGDLPVDNGNTTLDQQASGSYVYINAVPSAIHKDDEVTVTWDSSDVKSCSASSYPTVPGWSGSIEKTGSKYFSLKKPTTFIVKCTTTDGTVQASDSVSVLADDVPLCEQDNTCFTGDENAGKYVSVVMSASPYIVEDRGSSTLTWDTENASMCNANSVPLRDDWKGLIPQHAGETNITLPNTPVTYILTCTDGKTTGQTDVTISIDTSGIGDGKGSGNDPTDLCSQSGQESNPICLVKDISSTDEEKILILTDEEQATLDSLMKEVAIMSPTLPSNQTSSSLDISTQSYRNILSDINTDLNACYDLNKNQRYTDAAFERRIAGRRNPVDNAEYLINKYGWIKPSTDLINKYKAIPNWSWGVPCIKDWNIINNVNYGGENTYTVNKTNNTANTFVFPEMYTTCWLVDGFQETPNYEAGTPDSNPNYKRLLVEVEFKASNEFNINFN